MKKRSANARGRSTVAAKITATVGDADGVPYLDLGTVNLNLQDPWDRSLRPGDRVAAEVRYRRGPKPSR